MPFRCLQFLFSTDLEHFQNKLASIGTSKQTAQGIYIVCRPTFLNVFVKFDMPFFQPFNQFWSNCFHSFPFIIWSLISCNKTLDSNTMANYPAVSFRTLVKTVRTEIIIIFVFTLYKQFMNNISILDPGNFVNGYYLLQVEIMPHWAIFPYLFIFIQTASDTFPPTLSK